jgi:hypothetical protein
MGSLILQRAYNNDFSRFLSEEEYESMCRAVCVHMCGYHDTDPANSQTQYRWNLLRNETDTVKRILHPLSLADTFAAFGNSEEAIQQIIASRPSFVEYINQSANLMNGMHNKDGIIIQVKGTSGSGKSTLVRQMISFFGINNIVLIDRDDILNHHRFIIINFILKKIINRLYF